MMSTFYFTYIVGLSEAEYKVRIIDYARIDREGQLLDSSIQKVEISQLFILQFLR